MTVLAVLSVPAAPPSSAQTAKKANWTILVYVDADTNIEPDLLTDVESLATVDLGSDVNIVALVDRSPDYDNGPLLNLPNFDTAKLVKVEHGQLVELADEGEVDMGSPQTFSWFVDTGLKNFPANHYMVTIDDHGSGIAGSSFDDSTPKTDGHTSHLTLDAVSAGLESALQDSGVPKVDLFSYAACLMANYDAAAKLAPYASYLVASEEVSYGPQWLNTLMLSALSSNPNASATDLAATFVDNTQMLAADPSAPGLTMSVIDLNAMGQVTQALGSFAAAVGDDLQTSGAALGRAQSTTLHFGIEGEDRDYFQLYDIGDLLRHLNGGSQAVMAARDALYQAEKTAVVRAFGVNSSSSATGMSLYFPATVKDISSTYPQVAASSKWAQFLSTYFQSAGTTNGPGGGASPKFTSSQAQVSVDQNGVVVAASLVPGTDAALTSADMFGGIVQQDGTVEYLYTAPAEVGSGGPGGVSQGWDLTKLQLTSGSARLDAMLNLATSGDAIVASIPVLYQSASGEQAEAAYRVTIDAGGNSKGGVKLFQLDANGGSSEITPAAGDVVAPLVLASQPGGQLDYRLLSNQAIDATQVQFSFTALAPGSSFVVALIVSDAAGNTDVATATGTVP